MPEIKSDEITNRPIPAPGRTQDLRTIFAKKRREQTTAIPAKIAFAGRTAFTSV